MLKIRSIWKATELKEFKKLEEKFHYMGETRSGGDTLRLVIEDDGEWVAIMVWGGACYHLLHRDNYIGWSPALRMRSRYALHLDDVAKVEFVRVFDARGWRALRFAREIYPPAVWICNICKDSGSLAPSNDPRTPGCP